MLQHFRSTKIICGVDEAGRGCIAGPVVAAAVILPKNFKHNFLNDSKQLTEKQRNELRPIIEENAISYGIGIIDNHTIDEVNILQATYLAMHQAIDKLNQKIDLLIIDGNRFKPYKNIAHETIIKGDGKYIEIAAASVLAASKSGERIWRLRISPTNISITETRAIEFVLIKNPHLKKCGLQKCSMKNTCFFNWLNSVC